MENQIPPIIHYCWFGDKQLSKLARKCLNSWKYFFPDYEIKEWNESNFDIHICPYVEEAYEMKKWAFVSDYARFWILYHYGGIYFDTDVEVIKSMENVLCKGAFMACEAGHEYFNNLGLGVNPGLGLGAGPGLGFYREILNIYEQIHFRNADGNLNEKTVVDYTTAIMQKHGFQGSGEIEKVYDIMIYPPEYFSPMNYLTGKVRITENTFSIHYYSGSWTSPYNKIKTFIRHHIGEKTVMFIIGLKRRIHSG